MKHETPIDLWLYEKEAFADGFQLVCGVDEAGRGPLAGPVCAAAVILPPELVIPGLNDSKKLTDKKRRELCSVITAEAVSYGIAFASEQEIDEINILQATFLAMERAMAMNMVFRSVFVCVAPSRMPSIRKGRHPTSGMAITHPM